jgi:hypothetical protein
VGLIGNTIAESASNAKAGFVRCYSRFSGASARRGLRDVRAGQVLWALSAALGGLAALSCGVPTANFVLIAPSSATAGVPITVTVTAMVDGRLDTIFDGPMYFKSSDPAGSFPTLYVFTAADAGSHTFTNVTLNTPGNQTLTASDYVAAVITGTADITVSAAPAETQSSTISTATAGSAFSTRVSAEDAPANVPPRQE